MSRIVVFGLGPMRWETSTRLFALPLRTWHFASTLAADGHDVLLIAMRTASFEGWPPERATEAVHDGVTVLSLSEQLLAHRGDWIARRIERFGPDAIVGVNRDPAAIATRFVGDLPFWADINGDPMAEAQAKAQVCGHDDWTPTFFANFVPTLRRADAFSTCSRAQRSALIGQLSMVGRLSAANAGHELVYAVANSLSDRAIESLGAVARRARSPGDPFVVLWSGGYNTWCDPDLLFDALERAMDALPELTFVSTGGAIAGHHEGAFKRLAERVERSPHAARFRFVGWVETAELPRLYADADVAVLTDRPGYEGALGARTRMLDWLAAGLPIVTTRLSEISEELEAIGAARAVPCGDARGFADALIELARRPDVARAMGERGRAHALDNLRAASQLGALRAWARAPKRAPDRGVAVRLRQAPRESERLPRLFLARAREAGLYAALGDTRRHLSGALTGRLRSALGGAKPAPLFVEKLNATATEGRVFRDPPCHDHAVPEGVSLRLVVDAGAPNEALTGLRHPAVALARETIQDTASLDRALRGGDSTHLGWIAPAHERVGRVGFEALLAAAAASGVCAVAPRVLGPRGLQRWPEAPLEDSALVETLPTSCAVISRAAYVEAGGLDASRSIPEAVSELSARLRGELRALAHPVVFGTEPVTSSDADPPETSQPWNSRP